MNRGLLAISLCVPLAGCYNDAHEYRRLVDSHATVAGQVVYVDCHSHGLIVYSFLASGHEHRAKAPAGMFRCDATRRGDPVTVFHDPANPAVDTLLAPQQAYEQAHGWYVPELVFIIGAPFVYLGGSWSRQERSVAQARACGSGRPGNSGREWRLPASDNDGCLANCRRSPTPALGQG